MKKVMDLVKPFLSLIFGALLFLYFLNFLSYTGEALAMGVIAVTFACYYLAAGILGIVLGEKMPAGLKNVFNILSVSLYPSFMFVYFLLLVIQNHGDMGPTGWTIYLLAMVASISLAVVYVISRFVKNAVITRLAGLFGAIFVLALISDVLFAVNGAAMLLGYVEIVVIIIYSLYALILFNSLSKDKAE